MPPPVTRQIAQFDVQPSSNFADPPCIAASFEVNSEPHTGARPSVRLRVGLKNNLYYKNCSKYFEVKTKKKCPFPMAGHIVFDIVSV
jgi:hypothetical protein